MNTRKKTRNVFQPPDIYTINAKICRLVSENRCLYDRSDVNFLRTAAVQNAWKDIGNKLQIPAKTCQQRWRNMRDSYARSIKDNREATTYYMNKELQFLQNYITPGIPVPPRGRRPRNRRRQKQEDHTNEDQTDEDIKPKVEASFEVKHAQRRNRAESEDIYTSSEEDSENGITKNRLNLCKRSKENVQPITSNSNAERVLDFDDAFLQGLRPEINQMTFTQKLFFKRRIYDLLGEIFATELNPPNASSEVLQVNEPDSAPLLSTPLKPFGLHLQLPKLTPKPKDYL